MEEKENEVLEKKKNFESEIVYDGFNRIEKITRKSSKKEVSGEIIRKNETVVALIYNLETKKYIFIEDYKLAANGMTVEVLKGDVEKDEKPKQAVRS